MAATYEGLPAMLIQIAFLCVITHCYGAKLNVPKVLLPYYSYVSTNFTLEVSEGCYKWRSSRSEIATVMPLANGVPTEPSACSSQAVVTAVSKTPSRVTSVVMAEDPVSGQQLRCDVIVDVVHAISIETTTRELYLEDSPEQFFIRAKDDEGNVFSSTEGVAFEWTLISDTDVEQESIVDAHNVLRILPFAESFYETPSYIEVLENQRLQGDTLLVEGIRTGSAKVSARLSDSVYKKVPEAIVRLIVIANIVLNPPLVYVMRNTEVHYRVELLKQGKIHAIPMPSQQYYLDLQDPAVCTLDVQTSTVLAKQLGYTELVLKDRNIKVKEAFRQPTAGIYVVTPGYLSFVVLPGRKWVLETDRIYEIYIEIYDKDSHRIYPSDNVRVIAELPSDYFHVYSSSENGTYHVVRTLKKGNTLIEGQLTAVILKDGLEIAFKPVVKNSQDVEIYDPIRVLPPVLVFPWDPMHRATYQYPLTAEGGSGNYTWSSSDSSVASVTVRGQILTATVGETKVNAADVRNAAHSGYMMTYVVPPSEMEFLPSPVEAEIGTSLELPLAVYGMYGKKGLKKTRHRFHDCRKLDFDVEIIEGGVFHEMDEELLPLSEDKSCTVIKVQAMRLGSTEVIVTYSKDRVKLSASITIAAYHPLQPMDPESVAVVTVGSSQVIVFSGGPQPWVLEPSKYYQRGVAEKTDLVALRHQRGFGTQKNHHIFHVYCEGLGEQTLSVTVGNGVTAKNKFPASAVSSILFVCAPPVGLHLTPVVRHPQGLPPCPITPESLEPVPVPNYRDLEIQVVVTDSEGRRFDNFTSLSIKWEVSDPSVGILHADGVLTDQTVQRNGHKSARTYQMLAMKHKVGQLSVTATIVGYNTAYVKILNFNSHLDPHISSSVDLSAVHDAHITPDSISIFNHPSNQAKLTIDGGSGYFHLDQSHHDIARVLYDRKERTLQVMPQHEGSMVIMAHDLCVDSRVTAKSELHIAGVNTIIVSVVDKVELTKEIEARVRVLDKNGDQLLASYFPLMGLKAQTGSDIISLRLDPTHNPDPYMAQYIVHGDVLGRTTLQFVARPPSGIQVSSHHKEIQVFPPLRLDPRNITIIVGALFQVTAHGGPQPQSTIEFSIEDTDIATISNSGLVESELVGVTTVVGRAVGYEGDTGKPIIYSQDQVTVHVVELQGIRIHAPLKRLRTNTQMPLYAVGINEQETPFTFGSADPPLSFSWRMNSQDTVSLESPFHKSGLRVTDENRFGVHLFANKPGHVTVSLTVTPSFTSQMQIRNNAQLSDEVQIQVFEELRLTHPDECNGRLLLTPDTETFLRTNRDGTARMTYEVLNSLPTSQSAGIIVHVNDAGQLISGSRTGQATLKVTAHEDFGVNQTVVIHVKVKPVSYLMLNADTEIHTSSRSLTSIPVGAVLQFTVSFHDDVGEKFYATNTNLKYRANRFDLVHITPGKDNGTLVARTINSGHTVLKIWDEHNPQMADYLNINVGYAIMPTQVDLTLGDVACFHSPLLSSSGHAGHWSSSTSILSVRSQAGIAMATQIGNTVVRYSISDSLTTHTEVTVSPISKVSFRSDSLQYLSNVPSRSRAIVLPVILEQSVKERHNNLIGVNCSELVSSSGYQPPMMPFRCEMSMSSSHPDLSVSDLLQVNAAFQSNSGQYECRFTQVASADLGLLMSTLDTFIQLRVVVPERDGQPEVSSGIVSLPFLPAFHVHASEIHLNNLQALTSIRVSAIDRVLQDVKVSSSDTNLIEVLPAERDTQVDGVMHFPVKLLNQASLWDLDKLTANIEVLCVTTGQRVSVPVRVKLIGQKHESGVPYQTSRDSGWGKLITVISNNYQSWIFMILCITATIVALYIAYQAVLGTRYQAAANQSGVFLQQGQSPISPAFHPSPWNSPYSTGSSPSKVPLWTSGYELDNSALQRRSPANRSPYSS